MELLGNPAAEHPVGLDVARADARRRIGGGGRGTHGVPSGVECGAASSLRTVSVRRCAASGFPRKASAPASLRAAFGRQEAEDEDRGTPGRLVRLQAAAEREPVELRHQDLGDHDGGPEGTRELEGLEAVRGERDLEPGFREEIGLQVPHVRVAFDTEDYRPVHRNGLGQVRRPRLARPEGAWKRAPTEMPRRGGLEL